MLRFSFLLSIITCVLLCGCAFAMPTTVPISPKLLEVRHRTLPGLKQRLAQAGYQAGDPAFIRIYKESRELELWLKPKNSQSYRLWETYKVAAMSGKMGPKQKEGDRQAPEGFYSVTAKSLNPNSLYHLSFDIGYPNAFDKGLGRTGTFIMVHGSDVSIGCFAMTDPIIEEIYLIVESSIIAGQTKVPVHVFPFRMTDERMQLARQSPWIQFWRDLRIGHDHFQYKGVPPAVNVSSNKYTYVNR